MKQFISLVIPCLCLALTHLVGSIDDHGFRTVRSIADSQTQYLLMNGANGEVVIFDSKTFSHMIFRQEEETKGSLIAVHGDTLYAFNAVRGEIKSTKVANMLTNSPSPTRWERLANYPRSFQSTGTVRGNIAVMGDKIYFQSSHSAAFAYDTVTRTVQQLGMLDVSSVAMISVAAVNGIVYWRVDSRLVTFNGTNWGQVQIPRSVGATRMWTLTSVGDNICLIGGVSDFPFAIHNSTACYDTRAKTWSTTKGLHLARYRPAAVELEGRGIIVIAGEADGGTTFEPKWAESVELLNPATKESSLTHYRISVVDAQAVVFYA